VAALAFFLAAIFIVARFYSNRVEAGIAEVSLLKE
jgi:flagellar biogenesis protein FliO